MEVLCASDGRYLPHAATMLCSLLQHNSVFRIHFLYSSVDPRQLIKLKSLVKRYGSEIVFYEVAPQDLKDLRVDKWGSLAVYYRLLAPRLLPAELNKVLYLDSDIVVRRSLTELWNTDISDCPLAAVSNYEDEARKALGLPEGTKYFNSGVLLINLSFWRRNSVAERAISFVKDNPDKVQYWDQDALNAILSNQWVELPPCWNWQYWWRTSTPETEREPAIVHFIAGDKPWHWSNTHFFKQEYHRYRVQTPWRRYKLEGQPGLWLRLGRGLKSLARTILPAGFRQWLRSRLAPASSGRPPSKAF
jgi:lipopolysaccharide biosynthesis glycosyltransferase